MSSRSIAQFICASYLNLQSNQSATTIPFSEHLRANFRESAASLAVEFTIRTV
jgi:hypothetical protein